MNRTIYFAGSIRGGRQDAELYRKLIDELARYGEVLTEHIGSPEMETGQSDREIHDQDLAWLTEADMVVAEVTTPSLGVGYELGRAVAMGKRICCLYRGPKERVSAMVIGSQALECRPYRDLESARSIFRELFATAG